MNNISKSRIRQRVISVSFLCLAAIVFLALPLSLSCCGDDDDVEICEGPEIKPHLNPVFFGDFYPLPEGDDPQPGLNEYTPYEWTLLLSSDCEKAVVIDKICIVGDNHNGEEGNHAFTVEGPEPKTIPYGEKAAIRITYNHSDINIDGDGEADPDNVALIIQSNATNYPTLVIPICARIIPKGAERKGFSCKSPVTVEKGESDTTLCK